MKKYIPSTGKSRGSKNKRICSSQNLRSSVRAVIRYWGYNTNPPPVRGGDKEGLNYTVTLLPTITFFLRMTFVASIIAKTTMPNATIMARSENEGFIMPKASLTDGI